MSWCELARKFGCKLIEGLGTSNCGEKNQQVNVSAGVIYLESFLGRSMPTESFHDWLSICFYPLVIIFLDFNKNHKLVASDAGENWQCQCARVS